MRVSRAGRHPPGALARTQVTAGHPICSLTASSSAMLVPFSPRAAPPARLRPQSSSTGGPHPWKWCLLHQHPEVLNCPPPAEAFIIHPKPWGAVGLYSISPAYKGFSADVQGLTIPQIPPLQVKQWSSSPCTAMYHLCRFNSSC